MVLGMKRSWAASRRHGPVALLSMALALLPGCVDCFDDGELQASYRAGEASARELNEREFSRGYDEGRALTRTDGELDGDAAGYDAGYHDGYHGPRGYPRGVDEGYRSGHTDGLLDPFACSDGASQGQADGDWDGYHAGFDDSYDPAFDEGYGAGFDDGANSCGFRSASGRAAPEDLDTCEARGYQRALDRSAFPRGFDTGKAENPEYQAGHDDAYALAYPLGAIHGELDGYDEGLREGYDVGFIEGYDQSFALCYEQMYPDGYDAGYDVGHAEGLSVGYDDGYGTGYDDGRAQCPE